MRKYGKIFILALIFALCLFVRTGNIVAQDEEFPIEDPGSFMDPGEYPPEDPGYGGDPIELPPGYNPPNQSSMQPSACLTAHVSLTIGEGQWGNNGPAVAVCAGRYGAQGYCPGDSKPIMPGGSVTLQGCNCNVDNCISIENLPQHCDQVTDPYCGSNTQTIDAPVLLLCQGGPPEVPGACNIPEQDPHGVCTADGQCVEEFSCAESECNGPWDCEQPPAGGCNPGESSPHNECVDGINQNVPGCGFNNPCQEPPASLNTRFQVTPACDVNNTKAVTISWNDIGDSYTVLKTEINPGGIVATPISTHMTGTAYTDGAVKAPSTVAYDVLAYHNGSNTPFAHETITVNVTDCGNTSQCPAGQVPNAPICNPNNNMCEIGVGCGNPNTCIVGQRCNNVCQNNQPPLPISRCINNMCVIVTDCAEKAENCTPNTPCITPPPPPGVLPPPPGVLPPPPGVLPPPPPGGCPAGQVSPHYGCSNGQCAQLDGCGVNSCDPNNPNACVTPPPPPPPGSCLPPNHFPRKACNSNHQCVVAQECGPDTCTNDASCITQPPPPVNPPPPPFNPNACKCDSMEHTAIIPGQKATFTAFFKVTGSDVSTAKVKDTTWTIAKFPSGTDPLNQQVTKSVEVVTNTPTLIRYKSVWEVNIPSNVTPNTPFRVAANSNCTPKIADVGSQTQLANAGTTGVLGTSYTKSANFLDDLINFIKSLFGFGSNSNQAGQNPPPPALTGPVQSPGANQQLQLRPVTPADTTQVACSILQFQFNNPALQH